MGLYLQGLEEAHGIRTAARDEAEGGIGQCCPRVGPKEAQEGSSTRGLRQLPFPPPGSLNGFPAPHQHPQIHNVQTHRVLYVNKTPAQPRTDTHVPASHRPLPTAGQEHSSSFAFALGGLRHLPSLGLSFLICKTGGCGQTWPCMCLPSYCSATRRLQTPRQPSPEWPPCPALPPGREPRPMKGSSVMRWAGPSAWNHTGSCCLEAP